MNSNDEGSVSGTHNANWARISFPLPKQFETVLNAPDNWRRLHEAYAPYSLSDKLVYTPDVVRPHGRDISWCSIYTLALLALSAPERAVRTADPLPMPDLGVEWVDLVKAFCSRRNDWTNHFQQFLRDWGLDLPEGPLPSLPEGGTDEKNFRDDHRIIGLHVFRKPEHVVDYIHRWHENPDIRSTELRNHRYLLSRAVDLICSELLSNGFIHGIKNHSSGKVSIMAKLCPVKSVEMDLALHSGPGHLASSEERFFRFCKSKNCAHLQLIIVDTGSGFGGNQRLENDFLNSHSEVEPTIDRLIEYALSGTVSTRPLIAVYRDWKNFAEDSSSYRPSIHGLSEVQRCMKSMRGMWRIHSEDTLVERCYFESTRTESPVAKVRTFPGTLHYLAIPLLPEEEIPLESFPRPTAKALDQSVVRVELADFIRRPTSRLIGRTPSLSFDTRGLWSRIRTIHPDAVDPLLLINVRALRLFDGLRTDAICALLLNALEAIWETTAVILIGADELIKSKLARFTGPRHFLTNGKVLLLVDSTLLVDSFTVGMVADHMTQLLEPEIIHLFSHSDAEQQRVSNEAILLKDRVPAETSLAMIRDGPKSAWDCLKQLPLVNPRIFRTAKAASEDTIKARFVFSGVGSLRAALDLKGRSVFPEFREMIVSTTAYLVPTNRYAHITRLGINVPLYTHMGRIYANEKIRSSIVRSLLLQMQLVEGVLPGLVRKGEGLVLIPLLHPAIEIAQDLRAQPALQNAALIEVRRIADVRWDNERLHAAIGKRPIIVTDVVKTGSTINQLVNTLKYLEAAPLCVCSILRIGSVDEFSVPHIFFSECTDADLDQFARHLNASKEHH